MFFRKLVLTTALTSMAALSAHAATVEDEGLEQKNRTVEDAATTETETIIDRDTYEVRARERTTVGVESNDLADTATTKDLGPNESAHMFQNDNYQNILSHAEPGKDLHTSDGELVGSVILTRDYPDRGPVLWVDISAMDDVPVGEVGFTYDSINVMESGELQYGYEMRHLREQVLDKL